MKFNYTNVYNFSGAIHGMRNPLNSWEKSDSFFGMIDPNDTDVLTDVCDAWIVNENKLREKEGLEPFTYEMKKYWKYYEVLEKYESWLMEQGILNESHSYNDIYDIALLGPNDMKLAQKLILAGNEHAKFMRQIFVSVDITAPLYWWKEFDTYKVGAVANSTSTMHTLTSTPITIDCFEINDYNGDLYVPRVDQSNLTDFGKESGFEDHWHIEMIWNYLIESLEDLRQAINKEEDPIIKKALWKELIRILPEGWLQTRTWTGNYAILRNIYFQRKDHKLTEWHSFCDWIKELPYAKELITIGGINEDN